ncbi:hypothetical protein HYH03_008311 [Edaphochlamys debaryana]|uniref:Uncharacterized protein n=1 Tax=Edaphochlamys debaryana TaxID=47281 RepID=A0A836BYE0_9CHLO|nr:hypothetical protein HYH03_008311 [Edaphochlamys debaryana]|eukprot:KAG2493495.1 hypothetical protein HYH03_008311 [Edaphochlamys debaryana]
MLGIPLEVQMDAAYKMADYLRTHMPSRVCACCSCMKSEAEAKWVRLQDVPNVQLLRADIASTLAVLRPAHVVAWLPCSTVTVGGEVVPEPAPTPPPLPVGFRQAWLEPRRRTTAAPAPAVDQPAMVNGVLQTGAYGFDPAAQQAADDPAAAAGVPLDAPEDAAPAAVADTATTDGADEAAADEARRGLDDGADGADGANYGADEAAAGAVEGDTGVPAEEPELPDTVAARSMETFGPRRHDRSVSVPGGVLPPGRRGCQLSQPHGSPHGGGPGADDVQHVPRGA